MSPFFHNEPQDEPEYTLFVLDNAEETEEEAPASQNEKPLTVGQRLLDMFVPMRGDALSDIIRKIVAIIAVIAMLVAMGYLIYDLWIMPLQNEAQNAGITQLYNPDGPIEFEPEVEDFTEYPAGMNPAFKALYYANHDVRGWLTFNSSSKYWYGINYPVVQAADNDFYLYRDFYKQNNRNGTLYFDARNDFSSPDATNQVSIIYGHNMLSGQMLASLNKLLGSVGMARSAPTLTMNTLYEDATYKVFGVFIWDNEQRDFNYMQTIFADDADFMAYVEKVRARSWYDYKDVDVIPTDELLVLSTCSNKSQTHLSDGRTVVVARKVRDGESTSVNTAHIVVNEDALQPLAWYEAEGLTLPDYYNGIITTTTTQATATTTTQAGGSTTTTTTGSGDTSDGTTTTTTRGSNTVKPGTTTTTTTQKPQQGSQPTNGTTSATTTQATDTGNTATNSTTDSTTQATEETTTSSEETTTTSAEETTTTELTEPTTGGDETPTE